MKDFAIAHCELTVVNDEKKKVHVVMQLLLDGLCFTDWCCCRGTPIGESVLAPFIGEVQQISIISKKRAFCNMLVARPSPCM